MIDYIEIEGYKSIKKQKIELKPINILIGANGSGKSNFISFFEFLRNIVCNNLETYVALRGGTDKFLFQGKKITSNIDIKVGFKNGMIFYDDISEMDGEIFHTGMSFKCENKINDEFNVWAEKYNYLENLKKYHFHDTSANSPFTKMSHIQNDTYYLYEKGDNLAGMLYKIKETDKIVYNRIVKIIQSVAPYFLDFYLQPNEGNYLRLQWKDKFCDSVYGVSDLSDGTLRFIALTVLFMQPNLPETIIIDEPELGLHPFAVAKLAGMIKSASNNGCQVIIATQSAELINNFDFEDIVTVDLINGESVFNRLNSDDWKVWFDDYTIGDLWKQNILNKGYINR